MSDFIHEIYPGLGKLNYDDDLWAMPEHDSRYRLNIVVNDDGNQSIATNSPGTDAVSFSLPPGTNKVVGFVEDLEDKAGIYLVYNSNGHGSIVKYSVETNSCSYVLDGDDTNGQGSTLGSVLNIQDRYYSLALYGSGNGKTLVWTDNNSYQKAINISKAMASIGSSSGYDDIVEDTISVIKPAPDQPTLEYYSDSTVSTNNLRGDVFQFSYRHKFKDSAYSIYSELRSIISTREELTNDFVTVLTWKNNTIFIDGEVEKESRYVDLVYRKLNVGGVVGNFFKHDTFEVKWLSETSYTTALINENYIEIDGSVDRFFVYQKIENDSTGEITYITNIDDTIDRIYLPSYIQWGTTNINFTAYNEFRYPFRNNRVSIGESNALVLKQYESVPKLSRTVTTINSSNINGTRLVFSGNTEGYDVPNVDVEFSIVDRTLGYASDTNYGNVAIPNAGNDDIPYGGNFLNGFRYSLNFNGSISGDSFVSFYWEDFDSIAEYEAYVKSAIESVSPGDITVTFGPDINITNNTGNILTIYFQIDEVIEINQPHFKSGQMVSLALIYQDKYGRSCNVARDDTFDVYMRDTTDQTAFDSGSVNGIRYTIKHTASTEFRGGKWSWCMATANIAQYYQMLITYGLNLTDTQSSITEDADYWYIDLIDTVANEGYDTAQPPDYFDPVAGDRIRFLGSENFDFSYEQQFGVHKISNMFDEYIDTEIIENNSGVITIRKLDSFDSINDITDALSLILIEVYRPVGDIDDENLIFYQFGPWLDVDSNGYHSASSTLGFGVSAQNQTGAQDAIGTMEFGNSFVLYRKNFTTDFVNSGVGAGQVNTSYVIPCYLQTRSPFINKDYSMLETGKLYIKNDSEGEQYINSVRWSGIFNDESNINNIYRFDANDYKLLDERYNDIYITDQIGNVLLTIQENKVNSLYLSAEQGVDASGNRVLSYSNEVIGSVNPHFERYGTYHPRSYDRNNRHGYWWDQNNADVIRYAPNGMQPLGELYKMKSYFRAKSKEMVEGGLDNYEVIGKYDEDEDMYKITFIDKNTPANTETIGFYEPTNKWVAFYSYKPELYGKVGANAFLSFLNGNVHVHGSDTQDRNTFYGTAYDSEVWVMSNQPVGEIKIYDSLLVHSNKMWTAPDNDSIVISAVDNYSNGMQSMLKAGHFEVREGVYEAAFLRDLLTRSGTPNIFDLFQGRPLRGREIVIKLKNSDTAEVRLFKVVINSSLSQ